MMERSLELQPSAAPAAAADTPLAPAAFAELLLEQVGNLVRQLAEEQQRHWEADPAAKLNVSASHPTDSAWPSQACETPYGQSIMPLVSLSLPDQLAEEPSFVGEWIDVKNDFYGGAIVQFQPGSWGPIDPPQAVHKKATYLHKVRSASMWKLTEQHENQVERHFEAAHNVEEDTLEISLLTEGRGGGHVSWTLTRPSLSHKLFSEWKEDTAPVDFVASKTLQLSLSVEEEEESLSLWSYKNPYALWRMCWNLASCLMITCDLFWIPLQVFNPPRPVGVLFFESFVALFWAMDIPASFVTGYFKKGGQLERNSWRIAWRYLSSTFLFDLVLVSLDLFTVVNDAILHFGGGRALQASSTIRFVKSTRALRVLRVVRAFRFVRVWDLHKHLSKSVSPESLSIVMGVCLNMYMLVVANHLGGCLWFLIGIRSDDSRNWVDKYEVRDEHWFAQYLISLHWALSQVTPAPIHVHPENVLERGYTVVCILVAMMGFSTFVSSITASMTRLRSIHYEKVQQWTLLGKFLDQHHISTSLSVRLTQFLEHASARKKAIVQKESVALLDLLSEPLSKELQRECYRPIVTPHTFFADYVALQSLSFSEVCSHAIQTHMFSRKDILFQSGNQANCMCFQTAGILSYKKPQAAKWDASQPRRAPVNKASVRWVKAGQWFCEGALWLPWYHTGTMRALSECEVLSIDSVQFRQVALKTGAFAISAQRARDFVAESDAAQRYHGHVWDIPLELCLNPDESPSEPTEGLRRSEDLEEPESSEEKKDMVEL